MIAKRVMTALVLVAALLLVLFVIPTTVATALLALFFAIGAWEWARLAGFADATRRIVYVIGALMVGAVAVALAGRGGLSLLSWLDVSVWIAALAWMTRFPVPVPGVYAAASGLIVVPLGWLFMATLLMSEGPEWVLFLFALVAGADVGAFFAGRAFGRRKLAPNVSPGKTWEGVIGGLALAAAVGLAGALWFALPVGLSVLMGAGIAGFSILGDLTVSMLKRHVGLKDTGTLFPGHGGVLDRIDSVLAALPLFLAGFGRLAGA